MDNIGHGERGAAIVIDDDGYFRVEAELDDPELCFREPKTAKNRKVALRSKQNSSAGVALLLVKSRPKHIEMQLMKLP